MNVTGAPEFEVFSGLLGRNYRTILRRFRRRAASAHRARLHARAREGARAGALGRAHPRASRHRGRSGNRPVNRSCYSFDCVGLFFL